MRPSPGTRRGAKGSIDVGAEVQDGYMVENKAYYATYHWRRSAAQHCLFGRTVIQALKAAVSNAAHVLNDRDTSPRSLDIPQVIVGQVSNLICRTFD